MGKQQKYIEACKRNSKGQYCYIGETCGHPVSCSDFTKLNLYEAGIITLAEKNNPYSFWAGQGIIGILNDKTRFKRHEAYEKPQDSWIVWFNYGHVSTYYEGGVFESCPMNSHYKATNGKTAVGYFTNMHNCSGKPLTCYFEIIDNDPDDPTPVLSRGDFGDAVKTLQRILNQKISAGLDVDGHFGDKTLSAVKKYQESVGLTTDGIVGPKTWFELQKVNIIMPEPTEPKPVKVPSEVLKKGSSGDWVMTLQNLLNKKANANLNIDGKFGDKTLAAVKSFQKSVGIGVDGVVGPKTWTWLYQ